MATRTSSLLDTAAPAIPDPIGPLAAPIRLRADHHTPGDVLGGTDATPKHRI